MNSIKVFFIFALTALIFTSCGNKKKEQDDLDTGVESEEQFNLNFENLQGYVPPQIVDPAEIIGTDITIVNGVQCEVTTYYAAPGHVEAIVYAPFSDSYFLGGLIDGASISNGEHTPIIASLAPITISISLESIQGSPSTEEIADPNLSKVREAIVQLLNQLGETSTPAIQSYDKDHIYSEEQSATALGGKLEGFGANISFDWNWNSTETNSRMVYEFTQLYYTLDLNITHQTPSDYFAELPSIDVFNETVPVYLSSIKYGRRALFAVESSYSHEELERALNASMDKFKINGEINISDEDKAILENSSIRAFIMGGNGLEAAGSISNVENFEDFLVSGAEYSFNSPGAPLSYQLRYLHDNSLATFVNTAEYTIRDCEVVGEPRTITPFGGGRVDFCPVHEEGTSGDGIGLADVDFESKIEIRNGKEIWAITELRIEEIGDNQTTGVVNEETRLYTAPQGQHIKTIDSNPVSYFSYTDNDDESEISGTDFILDGDYIEKAEIAAVAGSHSLPCTGFRSYLTGDERCYLALWYKGIDITIGYD